MFRSGMRSAAIVVGLVGAAACGSASGEGEGQGAKVPNALSAATATFLTSNMSVVASLEYGQTSEATSYHNPAAYRAYRFAGKPLDVVDIWVRSHDGDAVAWLLDEDLHVLAFNDDADGTTRDAHVTATLPGVGSGTHYVAFTEYAQHDATFVVQLAANNSMSCGASSTCPDGYFCDVDGKLEGMAGTCITQCGHDYSCAANQHWEDVACQCVRNPTCSHDEECSREYERCGSDGVCLH